MTVKLYQYDVSVSDKVLRKFNPDATTSPYSTIDSATLTDQTIGTDTAAVATYTISDNGPLDLNPELGKISDPVGLASIYTPPTPPEEEGEQEEIVDEETAPTPSAPAIVTGTTTPNQFVPLAPNTGVARTNTREDLVYFATITGALVVILIATTAYYSRRDTSRS